jgi:hypothetical protein
VVQYMRRKFGGWLRSFFTSRPCDPMQTPTWAFVMSKRVKAVVVVMRMSEACDDGESWNPLARLSCPLAVNSEKRT